MATMMEYKYSFGQLYIEMWWPENDDNTPYHEILRIDLKGDNCWKLKDLLNAENFDDLPFIIKDQFGSYKKMYELINLLKDRNLNYRTSYIDLGFEHYDDD